jgi:hypothetical protein
VRTKGARESRGLLRRTPLVATGENPEVVGYQPFFRILYVALAAFFWPSVPMVFLVVAATVIHSPRTATKSGLIAFALSVMIIDVFCRISFYSIVDWILWDSPARYILGARVLTVVIVSTLLTMWLARNRRHAPIHVAACEEFAGDGRPTGVASAAPPATMPVKTEVLKHH